ncbi:Inhibitor of nuclear factor kappa-B kinase subunit alpha [Chionoecetes opilio]|uniref:Inhibitor of nuclear factor kappa-B kinase subunit alpha n=1 Tax=Chionoecetes opilio TaxID=41210 RepID=A0A8J4YH99_CHIOP|nr:Inhibitor of nuclear factor kappa-B kinase subunit alpha [Chionoecetes opilio]
MATEEKQEKPVTYPWLKDKVLGTGGFGTVTLWRHSDTGETIALKKCRWGTPGTGTENILTPKHVERWEKEVEIMNRLRHSAVVRCFQVPTELTGPPGDLPMLCMEYCSGGDLRKEGCGSIWGGTPPIIPESGGERPAYSLDRGRRPAGRDMLTGLLRDSLDLYPLALL